MNGNEKGRAWIELNTRHLHYNAKQLQKLLPDRCSLMPAVKADAYGHGAVPVAEELQKLGIRNYCVASAPEGAELRQAGIRGQILILGYTDPADFDLLREFNLTQTIVDENYGKALGSYGRKLPVHVGIDTGMHRLGVPFSHTDSIKTMWDYKNLRITGLYSHLCTSDGLTSEDRSYVRLQEKRFQDTVKMLRAEGRNGFSTHLQGSYGILNGDVLTGSYDLARVGIALYGVLSEPSEELEQRYDLKPVLSLKARIACVRELEAGEGAGYGLAWHTDSRRKIAAVTLGYADGYPRTLSNRGHALVRGIRVPVVGRVCMDQLLLDVTQVPDVRSGDEAVFIGRSKKLCIRAEDVAAEAGTISNEILSALGKRLRRMAV